MILRWLGFQLSLFTTKFILGQDSWETVWLHQDMRICAKEKWNSKHLGSHNPSLKQQVDRQPASVRSPFQERNVPSKNSWSNNPKNSAVGATHLTQEFDKYKTTKFNVAMSAEETKNKNYKCFSIWHCTFWPAMVRPSVAGQQTVVNKLVWRQLALSLITSSTYTKAPLKTNRTATKLLHQLPWKKMKAEH